VETLLRGVADPLNLTLRTRTVRVLYRSMVVTCGGVLYLLALLLPTAEVTVFDKSVPNKFAGYEAFELGWKALTAWDKWNADRAILAAAWLANPAIWAALVCVARGWRRWTMLAASLGLALALIALPRWYSKVASQPGYWVWLGSAVVPLIASMLASLLGLAQGRQSVSPERGL
jgi:hypothetical protein